MLLVGRDMGSHPIGEICLVCGQQVSEVTAAQKESERRALGNGS